MKLTEQHITTAIRQLGGDGSALSIKHEIETTMGHSINIAQLYTLLDRLEKINILARRKEIGTPERGHRKKTFFKILPHLLA